MRTKDELLTESRRAISKAPKEGQEMLAHEFLMLEVFIDIRDCLEMRFLEIGRQFYRQGKNN